MWIFGVAGSRAEGSGGAWGLLPGAKGRGIGSHDYMKVCPDVSHRYPRQELADICARKNQSAVKRLLRNDCCRNSNTSM